ncbi:hypothetical protein P8452_03116 [Trifolium repens]|nr:hypothetical protein P8452_03116 [Trifolium repens]
MCGLSLKGIGVVSFLEKLVIADVAALAYRTGTLAVFTNEKGRAINDSVITKHIHVERSLIALQGPLAAPVLQHLTKDDLRKLYFGEFRVLDINGSECFLTRTGQWRWWFFLLQRLVSEPNPEDKTTMKAITKAVLDNKADLGIIIDTDMDRCSMIIRH